MVSSVFNHMQVFIDSQHVDFYKDLFKYLGMVNLIRGQCLSQCW